MPKTYPPAKARKLILKRYGTLDEVTVYNEASSLRVGSGHEETPIDGESYCGKCGHIEQGEADPEFHPEAYVSDPDPRLR